MGSLGLSDDQRRRAWHLIRPWLAVLLRTAQCLTRREQDAHDLVQETALKAMRGIDTFQPGTDEKAWLLTIMRRAHVDAIRKASRQVATWSLDAGDRFDVAAPGDENQPGRHDDLWAQPDAMMQQFSDQAIIDALRQLPDDMRWTLLLVDIEGLEVATAAGVMGVATGTVKSRSHRARAMLRDRLHSLALARGLIGKASAP